MKTFFRLRTLVVAGCLGAVLLLGLVRPVMGFSITATNCSDLAVQAAINQASNGQTITIPPGRAIWSNQVYIVNRSVHLIGSGMGQTILTDGMTNNRSCLFIGFSTNRHVIIGNLTLAGNPLSPNNQGWIQVGNSFSDINNTWRIHDVDFTNIFRFGIKTCGINGGCVDHCTFEASPGLFQATGIALLGDSANSWTRKLLLGRYQGGVCVEDCSFYWPTVQSNGALDAYAGARWIFRNNTVTNTEVGDHGLDTGGINYRSPHSFEFYNNFFYCSPTNHLNTFFEFRGGTGVIYSNQAVSDYPSVGKGISITCYRATGSNTLNLGIFPPWGLITGSNSIDQNISNGWPAFDQIGFTSPIRLNGSQMPAPLYGWSNTLNGADYPITVTTYASPPWSWTNHPNVSDILKEGRDFFNHVRMPGYVPLVYPHPYIDPAF